MAAERMTAAERHEIPDRPPLRLERGETVHVGRRDADWPAFVFVECDHGSGWVPARHLSGDAGDATVLEPYDTTELATRGGDELEVLARDDESGWLWCRATDGREGWVPLRVLRPG